MNIRDYEHWEREPFAGCENPDVPMARWLLKHLPETPKALLDVGCGTGLHTKWFNQYGIAAHGITINRKEIEHRMHPFVGFGDMCDIPFPSGTFDCVFALGSVEHTFAPFLAFCEFNRVLKPGGWLFLDMPNIYNMEIMDSEYWYHKMILFPIQVRDLLLKSSFHLIVQEGHEVIGKGTKTIYEADACAVYLAQKTDRPIRWLPRDRT